MTTPSASPSTLGTFVQPRGVRPSNSDLPEVRDALLKVIRAKYDSHPRSLQKTMGPSEAGHPCSRNLVFKLSGRPEQPSYTDPWPSIVGTAVHEWLDDALSRFGEGQWMHDRQVRLPSSAVPSGSLDAALLAPDGTLIVIDFKILGNSVWDSVNAHPAADTYWCHGNDGGQYKGQIMLYGLGLENEGLKVSKVGLAVFGRAKRLTDLVIRAWDYDRAAALRIVDRAQAAQILGAAGVDPMSIPATPTPKGCLYCPYKGAETDGLCDPRSEK